MYTRVRVHLNNLTFCPTEIPNPTEHQDLGQQPRRSCEFTSSIQLIFFFFFKDFIYLFLERGEGSERGEKHQLVASHIPPVGDPDHNPGI